MTIAFTAPILSAVSSRIKFPGASTLNAKPTRLQTSGNKNQKRFFFFRKNSHAVSSTIRITDCKPVNRFAPPNSAHRTAERIIQRIFFDFCSDVSRQSSADTAKNRTASMNT